MTDEREIGGGKAIASLVLGIIGMIAWFIPLFGAPITIIGLVLGIKGMKSNRRGMAIAGVVLCIIGLVLTIINASIGGLHGYYWTAPPASVKSKNANKALHLT